VRRLRVDPAEDKSRPFFRAHLRRAGNGGKSIDDDIEIVDPQGNVVSC